MSWPQTGATNYHGEVGLSDKGRAIKGSVVYYVVWLGSMMGKGPSTCNTTRNIKNIPYFLPFW